MWMAVPESARSPQLTKCITTVFFEWQCTARFASDIDNSVQFANILGSRAIRFNGL